MAPPAATIDTFDRDIDSDIDIDIDILPLERLAPDTDTPSSFAIPPRLTVQSVAKRRAASGTLIAGVAAPADVDAFKGRTSHVHKRMARRWDRTYTVLFISFERNITCSPLFPVL